MNLEEKETSSHESLAEPDVAVEAMSNYQIRPPLKDKFQANVVKEIIHNILKSTLEDQEFSHENAELWSKSMADAIRTQVKGLGYPRYKYVVQVVLGEQKGAGIKSGARCLWDADTDKYSCDIYHNESLFCMAVVYAVFYY